MLLCEPVISEKWGHSRSFNPSDQNQICRALTGTTSSTTILHWYYYYYCDLLFVLNLKFPLF